MERKQVRTNVKTWKIKNNEWGELSQKDSNEVKQNDKKAILETGV